MMLVMIDAMLRDASIRLAVLRRETAAMKELRERDDSAMGVLQVGGFRKGGGESSAGTLLLPNLCEGKSEVVFGYQHSGGVESGE